MVKWYLFKVDYTKWFKVPLDPLLSFNKAIESQTSLIFSFKPTPKNLSVLSILSSFFFLQKKGKKCKRERRLLSRRAAYENPHSVRVLSYELRVQLRRKKKQMFYYLATVLMCSWTWTSEHRYTNQIGFPFSRPIYLFNLNAV